MKKTIAGLALATAAALSLTACGGGPSKVELACVNSTQVANHLMQAIATGDEVNGIGAMTDYHDAVQACFNEAGIHEHVPTIAELGQAGE